MSTINESIWNDIRRRGNGTDVKKEDDVNHLDVDGLYDYIKSKYEKRVFYLDKDTFGILNKRNIVVDIISNVSLFTSYDKSGKLDHILLSWSKVKIGMPFFDKLSERFNVQSPNVCRRRITEKDGTCTNQTYINVIDFFLANMDNMLVNESIWNDIRRRGIGADIKKEDNVNNMGIDDFVEYLVSKYRDKVYSMDKDHFCKEYEMDIVVNPIKDIVIYGSYVNDELSRIMVVLRNWGRIRLDDWTGKIIENSPDNFRWICMYSDRYELKLKEGDVTNQTYVDLIEFFLNNITLFESVWGDIRKRGNGVKKVEDIIHLDDKYADKFDLCLKFFVEGIVYHEKYRNDFNDFKEYIINDTKRFGQVWQGNTTIPLSDVLLPYVEDNWDKFDSIKKQINDRVLEEERKISKLGFKKEPGKTIYDTLYDWWDSLDDDKKNDILVDEFWDAAEERFYEDHLDDDEFTGEDLEPDEEWFHAPYTKQIEIYLHYSKMNESIWNDIRRQANGTDVKKEDDMHKDDFLMLRETAKMFRNVINSDVGQRNAMRVNGGKRFYIDDCDSFIKYILARKKEHFWNDVPDETYDKVIKFVKDNWGDCTGIQEFMDKYLSNINECDGVPGGLTPADVGGMGAAYFPGPNGEPGSGDLPMPTGHVYHQVAPFGVFIKELKSKKKKKKKFRKEDEPCSHSPNAKVYDYVDDYRDYVDRTYTIMNRKK